jgi:HD-like signal output (HDOD) protein
VKRILFVDDESDILEGLQRMLRHQRREWEMAFVGSGREALQAMEPEPFDVIVTDMKMPDMNGTELLTRVQEEFPSTVRIVLSGHADLEASMRSVSVTHQFLVKPCDADNLKEVVSRACSLQALLDDKKLQDAIGGVGELPVLPRTYQALTAALSEPEVDLTRVGGIVEEDPAIAVKILQLVNSSFFGIRREIDNLRQATCYLGANTIRDLVLSYEVFRQFDSGTKGCGLSLEREQAHSLLVGRIARRLLDKKAAAEQAFLAGMLHDLGRLILATKAPELWKRIVQGADGDRGGLHAAEETELGVSHAEIGAYLLGLWGMPYPVVEAVAHHHHPAVVPGQKRLGVLGAVHVANVLAEEQGSVAGEGPDALDADYLEGLGLLPELPGWRAVAAEEAAPSEKDAA